MTKRDLKARTCKRNRTHRDHRTNRTITSKPNGTTRASRQKEQISRIGQRETWHIERPKEIEQIEHIGEVEHI